MPLTFSGPRSLAALAQLNERPEFAGYELAHNRFDNGMPMSGVPELPPDTIPDGYLRDRSYDTAASDEEAGLSDDAIMTNALGTLAKRRGLSLDALLAGPGRR